MKTWVCPIIFETAMRSYIFFYIQRLLSICEEGRKDKLQMSLSWFSFVVFCPQLNLVLMGASAKNSHRCVQSLARSFDWFLLGNEFISISTFTKLLGKNFLNILPRWTQVLSTIFNKRTSFTSLSFIYSILFVKYLTKVVLTMWSSSTLSN